MPIQSGDVKLLKSAVMADVPEGGGAPTGFDRRWGLERHLSRHLRTGSRGGRVNLRKSFVRFRPTTPIPTSAPTSSWPAARRIARQRHAVSTRTDLRHPRAGATASRPISAKGTEWAGYLFGNHIAASG